MNHYQNLINYIDELILTKAKKTADGYQLSITDLYEDQLGQLAALFLEYDDRDTSECFCEPEKYAIDDDITCALLKMLTNNNLDDKEDLAELIRKNTIKRYSEKMQDYISERCQEVESEEMAEHGKFKHQDRNTGEHYWAHL